MFSHLSHTRIGKHRPLRPGSQLPLLNWPLRLRRTRVTFGQYLLYGQDPSPGEKEGHHKTRNRPTVRITRHRTLNPPFDPDLSSRPSVTPPASTYSVVGGSSCRTRSTDRGNRSLVPLHRRPFSGAKEPYKKESDQRKCSTLIQGRVRSSHSPWKVSLTEPLVNPTTPGPSTPLFPHSRRWLKSTKTQVLGKCLKRGLTRVNVKEHKGMVGSTTSTTRALLQ